MGTDLVIILSSDWVESTATRANIGEDRADTLQELHDTLLRRAIEANSGSVVKHSGDGVLAIFYSATGALGAAVQIQCDFAAYRASPDAVAPIDIRVGLAAGDVKQQSGDIFGMPVVEAVRLQSTAEPNGILCSDLVRMLSQGRGGFEFEDAGRFNLKGFTAPVHAFRVRRPDSVRTEGLRDAYTPSAQSRTAGARRMSHKIAAIAVVGVLGVALAVALGSRFLGSFEPSAPSADSATPDASVAGERPVPPPNSIAVIPFENLSPDENDAYFAIGIHEEILNQLQKVGGLHVIARTSVRRYAGTRQAISEIARELNVENVMEGSVRYADGRVVVTTQLIDGATDAHLWSDSYEREFSNIFAIQSDIALNVAQTLKTEILPGERAEIERAPTNSLAAYDLYLSALARRSRQTREEILRGLEEVDKALELDPEFADAWALKSRLSTVAIFVDRQRTPAERIAAGEQAARRALDIDPQLGSAYRALGFALYSRNDWVGGENAYRTALSLKEPLGEMDDYGVLQFAVGNFEGARDILQAARAFDPQNPTTANFLMTANALLGDWSTATAQYELGATLFPDWAGHGRMRHLRLARGEIDEARAIPASDPISAAMIASIHAPETALLELRRMYAADPSRLATATWAAYFGDAEFALEVTRAVASAQGGSIEVVWLPQFREARQRPEFKALMRDLGIVRYWQEFGWPKICRPLGNDDFECE